MWYADHTTSRGCLHKLMRLYLRKQIWGFGRCQDHLDIVTIPFHWIANITATKSEPENCENPVAGATFDGYV